MGLADKQCTTVRMASIGDFSIVEKDVVLSDGARVWNFCKIRSGAVIGERTNVGDYVYIGPGVKIGANSRIGNTVQIHHPSVVGDRVFVGPSVFIGNDKYPQMGAYSEFEPQPVIIEDDAIISACVSICGGVRIGRGAFVGMGANVLRDVPPGAIVFGNPAQIKGARTIHVDEEFGEHFGPLSVRQRCAVCGKMMEEIKMLAIRYKGDKEHDPQFVTIVSYDATARICDLRYPFSDTSLPDACLTSIPFDRVYVSECPQLVATELRLGTPSDALMQIIGRDA